ncbi:MAG: EAL domain-containing protein [Gallionella sp.]|nr:EAL domain-containing protein [Gallionella sp.]
MVLIVAGSILLTAIPGATLIYNYVERNTLTIETAKIEHLTEKLIQQPMQRFVESRVKLSSLARLLETSLAEPVTPNEIADFYRHMERYPDGVWRNRKTGYDGMVEAGIFLPPNPQESDEQKVLHWRIKRIMDTFGAAANRQMENVWYLSPHRSEIIFDTTFPNFAFDQQADNDYTQTPWVTYTSPALNPKREFRFTPPLFDPVPRVWMVSALYPLYVKGRWIGTLGEDMQLSGVLQSMFGKGQLYSGTQHFLLSNDGNYVLAGQWQKQLEATPETFKLALNGEPQLSALLESALGSTPKMLSDNLMLGGHRFVLVGMRIEPMEWRYFRLTPVDEIMKPMHQMFTGIILIILLVTILSGVITGSIIGKTITRRIRILSSAIKGYTSDQKRRISGKLVGNDEIAEVAHAFDAMAEDIAQSDAQRESARLELKKSEELWRFALEGSGDGVWDWDIPNQIVMYSRRWKEMLGFTDAELPNRFEEFDRRIHPEDRDNVFTAVQQCFVRSHPVYVAEFRMRCKDGSYKWILARGMLVSRDAEGHPLRMIGTHTDISGFKHDQESLQLASMVYRTSTEAIIITDASNLIIAINPAFTEVTGYSEAEVLGRNPRMLSSGRQDAAFYQKMWRQLESTGKWQGEIWNRHKQGEEYAEWLSINTIYEPDGKVLRRIGLFHDITEKKHSSETIWRQANFDVLTGLPNRRMLQERLVQEIKKAQRAETQLALLFIDLDRFKEVNDTLGHHVGDEMLIEAANRLDSCVRETDAVARLGGDEFTVLLTQIRGVSDIDQIAQEIISNLARPYQLGSELVFASASVGISVYPDDTVHAEQLMQYADQAMYVSKEQGRNRYSYFTASMQGEAQNRLRLITELRVALQMNQLRVYFQPIVELNSGLIRKAEALLRWQHPERGLIGPMTFIALAEETGLIIEIGEWVFHEAAQWVAKWNLLQPGFQISVNKSPVQFRSNDSAEKSWPDYLHELGLTGRNICVEITEGLLLNQSNNTVLKLLSFRDHGIQVSVDDFGTGYSALSYLKKFDIDYLKIDMSFVRNIVNDPADQALCEAIVVMAHKLGLKVIAEGVETMAQRNLLIAIGCDYGQGYLFGKPMPGESLDAILRDVASMVPRGE